MLYSLTDYESINIENFILSEEVMDCLSNLETILNVDKKDTFFEKKPKSWNTPKTFVKTSFMQNISDEDKIFNEIRNSLNKMSLSNYESQKDKILENINKCEDKTRVVQILCNVAYSNKVFSELYAKLYKELTTMYDFFVENIPIMLGKYKNELNTIVYKDPNIDYDDYCTYTKNNDILRASLLFYINLFKYDLLNRDDITELIVFILDTMDTNVVIDNRRNELEEYVEQLFVLCKNVNVHMCGNFEQLKAKIERFSKLKNENEIVSMSSRVNFRCMDIMDSLK